MKHPEFAPNGKPFDIHERLLLFACDVVNAAQFLHSRGGIARAVSYQLLSAGTSAGANAEEADAGSSHADFIAKNRIALREAKEARFRLRVCRRCGLLDETYDPLMREAGELVKILAAIVHAARRNQASRPRRAPAPPGAGPQP
jgi:four helix bundle protein